MELRKLGIENKIIIEDFELSEITQIIRIFNKYKISEVYNLAAQSFVGSSFLNPISTSDVTGLGVLRILEVIRNLKYKPKFYQASSSEMFGDVLETPQTMKTPFNPVSHMLYQNFLHIIQLVIRDKLRLYLQCVVFVLIMSLHLEERILLQEKLQLDYLKLKRVY